MRATGRTSDSPAYVVLCSTYRRFAGRGIWESLRSPTVRLLLMGTFSGTKLLILIACCALLGGMRAFGQSVSVSATASVVVPITVTAVAPLSFGSVARGTTVAIPATSASAGAVSFSGDASDQITISIPGTATISTTSGDGGTLTVTIARNALRKSKTNNHAGATSLNASSGTATVSLSGDASGDGVNHDGLGQYYLWIGGSVTVLATQQRGSYAGTFTITAVYSN